MKAFGTEPGSVTVQSAWDLWWTKWHCDRFFSQYFSFPPVSVYPPMLSRHFHLHVALTRRTNGRSLGTFRKKQCSFVNREAVDRQALSFYRLYLAAPWLRRSVAGLSPRRPRFDPSSVHVRFVVEKVALWQVFLPVLQFSPCQCFSTNAQ